MSAAQVRKVELRLERLMSQGAGPTVNQALKAATRNLGELQPECLRVLDDRLARLASSLAIDPGERPSDDVFETLLQDADEALTACSPLDLPLMSQALLMFSAQADALRQVDRWPVGALSPAMNFLTLVRSGHVGGAAAERLVRELQTCLRQYVAFAGREIADA